MALTPVYQRTSLQVPLPQVPVTPLDIVGGVATTFSTLAPGGTTDLSAFNKDMVRGDLLGRYGGGAIAVLNGLDLQQGVGLAPSITPGQAMVDGPVPETLATVPYTSPALADNNFNFLWFSAGGVPNKNLANADGTPPAAPDSVTLWCYLGGYQTAGSVQTGVDYSGRFSLLGGMPYVQTADTGEPEWTPPATTRFLHRTLGGLYLWDGTQYNSLDVGTAAVVSESLSTIDALQLRLNLDERKLRALLAHLGRISPRFVPPSLTTDFARGLAGA